MKFLKFLQFSVCRLLEQEKMEHRELKQTWKMANDQFLEQQTMLSWEIEKMKRFLTPVQLEKLSKEVRQKKALTIKTVAEEPYMVGKPEDDLIKFDIDPSKSERVQTASDIRLVEVSVFHKIIRIHAIVVRFRQPCLAANDPEGNVTLSNFH